MKLPLALFQFLSIFSLLCSNSASAQCLDNQKSSLLTLFGSAPTPFWTPSTDCCQWKGITCDRSGHVTGLDLTSHSISAPINSTSFTFLSSLRIFNLSDNALRGNIPSSLFRLPTLQYLNLSNNLFDAPLDEFNLPSSSLKSLDLSNNRLQGPIPTSLFQLKRLRTLSLSSNNLNGTVDLFMLQNIKNLSSLDLSNNGLSINTSGINASFPQIGNLKLSSCNLREFPDFLRNQLRLSTLDLSYNRIDGEIPNWVWRIGNGSLKHLDLSHNMVDSLQPPDVDLSMSKLNVLDLHANKLQGSMPIPPPSIVILDYSGNNLTSVNPTNISLYLNHTIFFSLSKNRSLPKLQCLILRSNMFLGPILQPEDRNAFSQLRSIDLSSNSFTGNLSSEWFLNLKAMMDDEVKHQNLIFVLFDHLNRLEYYQYNAIVTLKGLEMEVLGILTILTSIDLSCNRFHGSIPDDIGNLKSLKVLNMSRNEFTGSIPSSIENLTQLDSLDLSRNQLSGEIPTNLTALTFLAALNLSENLLVGKIPQAHQFLTFTNSSFLDNVSPAS
ncbi:hypothetical protein AAC387_Pa01g0622 [Persea americana]